MPRPLHHRRDFVRALVLGGPATTLVGRSTSSGEARAEDTAEPAEPGPKSESEARMDLVLARFGKSLDDDARASVRGEVEAIVQRAELLRKFPLDNGDGPFPVFIPYRRPLIEEGIHHKGTKGTKTDTKEEEKIKM
jgi:hypothetical protein